MPRQLSDEKIAVVVLDGPPSDPNAISEQEFNAGTHIECRIMSGEYRLSPSGSDTVNQSELCSGVNAVTYGRSNYDATITVFRYLTGLGAADGQNDVAWDFFKEKGTTLHLVEREGPEHSESGADGQEYSYFEVVTDDPQVPQDRSGFTRRTIPLGVQNAALNKYIGGSAS